MKRSCKIIVTAGLVLLLGVTLGWTGSPPNPTSSDVRDNTAGGTNTLINNSSFRNTGFGFSALKANTTGSDNTATGSEALTRNTTGGGNTASGSFALFRNTAGYDNTAIGDEALQANTSGSFNTATGQGALASNTTGSDNAATGADALAFNTTGLSNTATGTFALQENTTGRANTATGTSALVSNTIGSFNTATGTGDLQMNTTGGCDTATGFDALTSNTTGSLNTAIGDSALEANTTGAGNVAVGLAAGSLLTTGSNNIDIGNSGQSGESNTIRIGTLSKQTATYIVGIAGVALTGADVVVNGRGQLGVMMSSARYKRDVHDMRSASDRLMKLRPVSFRYKDDETGTRQYGLVAEEVERVYPELVTSGPDGKVETVRYSELAAMLLNELQKQTRENARQADQIRRLSARLSAMEQAMQMKNAGGKLAAAFTR